MEQENTNYMETMPILTDTGKRIVSIATPLVAENLKNQGVEIPGILSKGAVSNAVENLVVRTAQSDGFLGRLKGDYQLFLKSTGLETANELHLGNLLDSNSGFRIDPIIFGSRLSAFGACSYFDSEHSGDTTRLEMKHVVDMYFQREIAEKVIQSFDQAVCTGYKEVIQSYPMDTHWSTEIAQAAVLEDPSSGDTQGAMIEEKAVARSIASDHARLALLESGFYVNIEYSDIAEAIGRLVDRVFDKGIDTLDHLAGEPEDYQRLLEDTGLDRHESLKPKNLLVENSKDTPLDISELQTEGLGGDRGTIDQIVQRAEELVIQKITRSIMSAFVNAVEEGFAEAKKGIPLEG